MKQRLVIRDGGPQDSEIILKIQRKADKDNFPRRPGSPRTSRQIRRQILGFSDRETYLVLERDREIIGWGLIQLYSDRAGYRFCCEPWICLCPFRLRYRSALRKAVLKRCRQYGYHHLLARVFASDGECIEYHQRCGFQIVGTQREICFRNGLWQDVVIMQLLLKE